MAKCILATNPCDIHSGESKQQTDNILGITYHTKTLGGTISQDQAATYRLAPAALNTIHQQATSWEDGPGRSQISGLEIESQRQTFIKIHGNDGLSL